MYVKSYYPGSGGGKKNLKGKIKSAIAKKSTRIALFVLAGVLLVMAAAIFIAHWYEGEEAARKAEQLLVEVSMQPSPSLSQFPSDSPAVSGAYQQPEEPDAQSEEEVQGLLETELKGYSVIARLDIEKIDQHLPVLSTTSDKALKVSVCYYSGVMPDGDGNLVITGHNYRNGAHFGKLDKLEVGDSVTLTDKKGNTYTYAVYKLDHIKPDNPEALDDTAYSRELTLLTCEARGNRRLVVRCKPKVD